MMRRITRTGLWIISAVCVFFGLATPPAQAAAPLRANGNIYFRDDNPGTGLPGIFAMTPRGANKTLISPNVDNNQFDRVSISPDGTKLAFQQFDTLGGGTNAIVVANADGSGTHTLVPASTTEDYLFPIWSPDGAKIAYIAYNLSTTEVVIRTIDPDSMDQTTLPITLSNNPSIGSLTPVTWSSNNSIAYIDNDDIYTVNVDGSNATNVTAEAGWVDAYPTSVAWSPDGTKLAFTAALCPGVLDSEGNTLGCLATMNTDGSNKTIVVRAFRPTPNCSLHPIDASWSPDGTKLTYSKEEGCVF